MFVTAISRDRFSSMTTSVHCCSGDARLQNETQQTFFIRDVLLLYRETKGESAAGFQKQGAIGWSLSSQANNKLATTATLKKTTLSSTTKSTMTNSEVDDEAENDDDDDGDDNDNQRRQQQSRR